MTKTHYPINCNGFRTAKVNPDIGFLGEQKARLAENPLFQHAQKHATTAAPYRRHGNKTIISPQGHHKTQAYRLDEDYGCEDCNFAISQNYPIFVEFIIDNNSGLQTLKQITIGCERHLSQYQSIIEDKKDKAALQELQDSNELPAIQPVLMAECSEDSDDHSGCLYAVMKESRSGNIIIQKCVCNTCEHPTVAKSDESIFAIAQRNAKRLSKTKRSTKRSHKK